MCVHTLKLYKTADHQGAPDAHNLSDITDQSCVSKEKIKNGGDSVYTLNLIKTLKKTRTPQNCKVAPRTDLS